MNSQKSEKISVENDTYIITFIFSMIMAIFVLTFFSLFVTFSFLWFWPIFLVIWGASLFFHYVAFVLE